MENWENSYRNLKRILPKTADKNRPIVEKISYMGPLQEQMNIPSRDIANYIASVLLSEHPVPIAVPILSTDPVSIRQTPLNLFLFFPAHCFFQ